MNAIELRLWKNRELLAEHKLDNEIKHLAEALQIRKKFVDDLAQMLGDFFPDLVSGPIEPYQNSWQEFFVPIRYNGKDGKIVRRLGGGLDISIGHGYSRLGIYGLDDDAAIADWIDAHARD